MVNLAHTRHFKGGWYFKGDDIYSCSKEYFWKWGQSSSLKFGLPNLENTNVEDAALWSELPLPDSQYKSNRSESHFTLFNL